MDQPESLSNVDDFIRFTDGDMTDISVGAAIPSSVDCAELGPSSTTVFHPSEIERQKKFEEIVWEEGIDTVEWLKDFDGVLTKEGDVCGLEDLRSSNLPVVEMRASSVPTSGQFKTGAQPVGTGQQQTSGYTPFESPLVQLRSYRYFGEPEVVGAKKMGACNRIDPFKLMCKYETMGEGGVCKDPQCSAQHFKDISLTENEVLLDLLARLESSSTTDVEQLRILIQRKRALGANYDELIRLIKAQAGTNMVFKNNDNHMTSNHPTSSPGKYIDHRVFRNVGVGRSGLASTKEEYPPSLIPPSQAIFLQGLQSAVDGEKPKVERYYDIPLAAQDYESMIARDPTNIHLRIEYAASLLPSGPLSTKELLKTHKGISEAINILGEALQANRESEDLWICYLELYMKRAGEEDVRDMFEQGIGFLPGSLVLWWRYFVWEIEFERKEKVGRRMLISFTGDEGHIRDPVLKSIMVLSITIQLMKLYMHHSDNSETARSFMAIFLRCKDVGELERFSSAPGTSSTRMNGAFIPPLRNTWAAAVLTYRDLSKAWLTYFHFLYHGSLPRSLFLSYPHDYLIRDELFLIRWDAGVATGAQNATTPSGTEMAWFKQIFQNCVQAWKVACPKKTAASSRRCCCDGQEKRV
ncbi:hypothetical protein BDR26DRAFT_135396 [Obelidium mucronatum]|nr:hypothetical protein BDR26DRAFT_135396 [Obelidium mucronatum]